MYVSSFMSNIAVRYSTKLTVGSQYETKSGFELPNNLFILLLKSFLRTRTNFDKCLVTAISAYLLFKIGIIMRVRN